MKQKKPKFKQFDSYWRNQTDSFNPNEEPHKEFIGLSNGSGGYINWKKEIIFPEKGDKLFYERRIGDTREINYHGLICKAVRLGMKKNKNYNVRAKKYLENIGRLWREEDESI